MLKVLSGVHQSLALLTCFSRWAKHGGHTSSFSRKILFVTFWLDEVADCDVLIGWSCWFWRSDWLKTLRWLVARNPVRKLCVTFRVTLRATLRGTNDLTTRLVITHETVCEGCDLIRVRNDHFRCLNLHLEALSVPSNKHTPPKGS